MMPVAWRQAAWLALQLARREVALRYRGSVFGLAWALIHPLVMLGVYGFVFGLVLQARWPGVVGATDPLAYVALLFSGLALHGFLAECLVKAPGLILSNTSYVKKVVFPLPVLALAQWAAALFHLGVSLLVLAVFQLLAFGWLPVTALLLPCALVPLAAFGLGAMWALSAVAVYFRDLAQVVGLLATLMLFLSPALYPLDSVPAALRAWLYFNPLTPALELVRELVFWGRVPPAGSWLLMYGWGLLGAVAGAWIFARLRRGFADVL